MSSKSVETLSRSPARRDASAAAQGPAVLYLRIVYSEGLAHDAPLVDAVIPLGDGHPTDVVVGRAPDDSVPNFTIDFDAWASRSHTQVSHFCVGDQKGLVVSDLHSRNGTWVDGKRITQRTPIGPGQCLRVGSTLMVVGESVLDSEHQPITPSPAPPVGFRCATAGMVALWNRMEALANSDVGVLILGEMGTGKTHLARLLHNQSGRHGQPFVPHNCSAIPLNLEEATLFGIVGGFIPSVKQQNGLLSRAAKGTLFLDELADMPALAQAKLLDAFDPSVLSYLPVGGSKRLTTSCRLVCATNRDVFELAQSGVLRHDLLSRLVVGQLSVPPLRERREDLLGMFTDALAAQNAVTRDKPCVPNVELADAILNAHWTENVRGLQGLATRFALGEALSPEDVLQHANRGLSQASEHPAQLTEHLRTITPNRLNSDTPPYVVGPTACEPAPAPPLWPPRPKELLEHLAGADWNVKECAERLGRRRETVARMMRQLFGDGGKVTAQRAYRVWRASERVPGPTELDAVFAVFFDRHDAPNSAEARDAWRSGGAIPGRVEPRDDEA